MDTDSLPQQPSVRDPLADYVLPPDERNSPRAAGSLLTSRPGMTQKEVELEQTRRALAASRYPVIEQDPPSPQPQAPDPSVWPPPVYGVSGQRAALDPLLAMTPYHSPTRLGRIAIIFQFLSMMLSVFALTFHTAGGMITPSTTYTLYVIVGALACINIIAGIVFLNWINRVYKNLKSFQIGGLTSNPFMAVVSWFIPGLNMYRPMQIMVEIWKASDPEININPLRPDDWKNAGSPLFVYLWWFVTLGTGFSALSRVASAPIFAIVRSILTMFIVNEISSRQDEKFARFQHETSII